MTPILATPDAVRDLVAARQAFLRAIEFDREHGVSANKIAGMAAKVVSRPVVLRILHCAQTRANAVAALKDHGIGSFVDVGIAGGSGWGATHVYILLSYNPAEVEPTIAATLFTTVTTALASVGMSLGDATEQAFWDGEELPITSPAA